MERSTVQKLAANWTHAVAILVHDFADWASCMHSYISWKACSAKKASELLRENREKAEINLLQLNHPQTHPCQHQGLAVAIRAREWGCTPALALSASTIGCPLGADSGDFLEILAAFKQTSDSQDHWACHAPQPTPPPHIHVFCFLFRPVSSPSRQFHQVRQLTPDPQPPTSPFPSPLRPGLCVTLLGKFSGGLGSKAKTSACIEPNPFIPLEPTLVCSGPWLQKESDKKYKRKSNKVTFSGVKCSRKDAVYGK